MEKEVLHIYTRVSSLVQADQGTSLGTQLELGIQRAKELSFDYKHWDEGGKSSFHENIQDRPVLFQMFEQIKSGKIKHLWIYDQSRLSRNDQVASIFRYECNKQGVTLYTKDGQLDLSNPSDKLLKHLLDGIAEFDNAVRSERTRLGKINKVKSGFWHGGPAPYGYKIENKKLVIEKNESKYVKKIFDDILKGVSTLDIKKYLDSKGVFPRRAKGLWTLGSLQSLVKNTHYCGFYYYKDKKSENAIRVECPSIVDEVVWKNAQQLRTREVARTPQKNRTKRFYLLRDLMFCGHCNRPMGGRIKEEKNEYLYYCPNKERAWLKDGGSKQPWKRGVGCGMARSLNIKDCDSLVWKTVTGIHEKSRLLREKVKDRILNQQDKSFGKNEEELKVLTNRIKRLDKELLQAQEALGMLEFNFLSGEIDTKIYEFAKKLANEKIETIDTAKTKTQLEIKGNNENKKWVNWVKMFGDEIKGKDSLSETEKKTYIEGLVQKIIVKYLPETNQHQIEIYFELPIVNDDLKWINPNDKSMGSRIINGESNTTVTLEKKDIRWKTMTPVQNHSVTVE